MSTQNPASGDSRRDQVIAGEYVLGVLSADDRRKVEARIVLDGTFAAMVEHWQSNLASFEEAYEPVTPPPRVFATVERRLFADPVRSSPAAGGGLWGSLALWRVLTLASVAGLVTVATFSSGILEPDSRTKPLVAELSGEGSATMNLLAQYDAGNGLLKITPVAAGPADAKSLELWLIEGDNAPKSLGVLPQTGLGEVIIPSELRAKVGEGVTLAISVEPFGGSTSGAPTGAVIAAGKTRLP